MQRGKELLPRGAAVCPADGDTKITRQKKAVVFHRFDLTEVDPVALMTADEQFGGVCIQQFRGRQRCPFLHAVQQCEFCPAQNAFQTQYL